jgi:hypothetical protein
VSLDVLQTWQPVRNQLERRASVLDINEDYAKYTTRAWMQHKTGGDYWTPFLQAQREVMRAATGISHYPPDPESDAPHGFGPGPAMYLLAVETHDMHTEEAWREAYEAMKLYFHHAERLRNNDNE